MGGASEVAAIVDVHETGCKETCSDFRMAWNFASMPCKCHAIVVLLKAARYTLRSQSPRGYTPDVVEGTQRLP